MADAGKDRRQGGKAEGSHEPNGPAADTKFPQGEAAEAHLRDASAAERDAWGRINDRDVARSLRELWDKIPPAYRLMVTQYFRDITEPDAGGAAGDEAKKPDAAAPAPSK